MNIGNGKKLSYFANSRDEPIRISQEHSLSLDYIFMTTLWLALPKEVTCKELFSWNNKFCVEIVTLQLLKFALTIFCEWWTRYRLPKYLALESVYSFTVWFIIARHDLLSRFVQASQQGCKIKNLLWKELAKCYHPARWYLTSVWFKLV